MKKDITHLRNKEGWISCLTAMPEETNCCRKKLSAVNRLPENDGVEVIPVIVTGRHRGGSEFVVGVANRIRVSVSAAPCDTLSNAVLREVNEPWQWSAIWSEVIAWMPMPLPYSKMPVEKRS